MKQDFESEAGPEFTLGQTLGRAIAGARNLEEVVSKLEEVTLMLCSMLAEDVTLAAKESCLDHGVLILKTKDSSVAASYGFERWDETDDEEED